MTIPYVPRRPAYPIQRHTDPDTGGEYYETIPVANEAHDCIVHTTRHPLYQDCINGIAEWVARHTPQEILPLLDSAAYQEECRGQRDTLNYLRARWGELEGREVIIHSRGHTNRGILKISTRPIGLLSVNSVDAHGCRNSASVHAQSVDAVEPLT